MMILLSGVLCAFGGLALYGVVQSSPALSPDLRFEAPGSDWRPRSNVALFELYDHSRYLRERSDAFLRAAGNDESGIENAIEALDLAFQGVDAAPADAYAWTLLAATAAANGFDDMARTAIARSRELAPNNMSLAFERIALANVEERPLSEAVKAGLARDIAVARRFRPGIFNGLLNEFPDLVAIVETVEPVETVAPVEPPPADDQTSR